MDKCTNRERVVRKMNRQTDAVMVGGADVRMDRRRDGHTEKDMYGSDRKRGR
jgi:hypothetical protein